jgi:hypothetical protein
MNCKPKDLAVVISNPFKENLGAVLEVIEDATDPGECRLWLCKVVTSRPLLGYHRGALSDSSKHGDRICMPDKFMRPVSGLPMTEWDELERKVEDQLRKLREARV